MTDMERALSLATKIKSSADFARACPSAEVMAHFIAAEFAAVRAEQGIKQDQTGERELLEARLAEAKWWFVNFWNEKTLEMLPKILKQPREHAEEIHLDAMRIAEIESQLAALAEPLSRQEDMQTPQPETQGAQLTGFCSESKTEKEL